ncbi:MAG: hypothetical protein E8D46_07295 [Nitrospira sp.]|nr:MAG: hypothetical protein E8D46_07295 [Nitrospira sp.]
MRVIQQGVISGILSWLLFLTGCAAWSPAPQFSQPYFTVDVGEAKALQALARKQEVLAQKCAEHISCDHVYFMRALLGLYESRDSASKYFEKVIAIAPKSQLAASSKLWIELLEHHAAPIEQSWLQTVLSAPAISESQAVLALVSDRLVRDLLDRELTLQQFRAMKEADSQALEALQRELAERERKVDSSGGKKGSTDPSTVLFLQKQLTDRERKIEELTSQLEALKRIDQEMRDKVRPIRPPSTVAPPPAVPEPMTQ